MAAYAAAVSLMHIIDLIKNHPSPPICFDRQQFDSLTEIVTFLQEFLEGYVSPFSYSDEADPLEMRIAEAAYAAEDVIESYIVDNVHDAARATHAAHDDDDVGEEEEEVMDNIQLVAAPTHHEDEQTCCFNICKRLRKVIKATGLRKKEALEMEMVKEEAGVHDDDAAMEESYAVESVQLAAAATHHEDEQIQYINFYHSLQKVIEAMDLIKKETMEMETETDRDRGEGGMLEAEVQRNVSKSSSIESKSDMVGFEEELLKIKERLIGGDSNRQIIPIVGMGGIGKTTLARNVFDDQLIKENFHIRVWATISQDCNIEQTLREVLTQAIGGNSGGENSVEKLYQYLFGRKYLVVLDDMWSIEAWDKMRCFFPSHERNGSRIIVTTRMSNLADLLTNSSNSLCLSFLKRVDSWTLFSKTVFGIDSEGCVPELREIGEKIVEKCKGLPLSIVVIGGLLAKSERTQGYWEYIEKNLNSIVNSENEEYCSKVLKLSYNHLPVYLKPCFLYMGVFDEDWEIEVSTIINLWVSEGFLKTKKNKSMRTIAKECLKELVDRNLIILVRERRWGNINIKYVKIHDLLKDLSLKEAEKQKFYHVLRQRSPHPMYSQRRIVIPKNTSEVTVRQALESPMPCARSYLFYSDLTVRQLLPDSRLLRTLNAFDLRGDGHSSSKQVLRFVNSRHLVFGVVEWYPEMIPSCIKMLWNLRTLIVDTRSPLTAPVEIWKMHQLEHVEFTNILLGSLYLPHPPPPNADDDMVIMKNLHTLKGVRDFDLNEDTVKRIPNIKKLGIIYETERVNCLSHLGCLRQLENLRLLDACHEYMQGIKFPETLKKLNLMAPYVPNLKLGDMMLQEIGSLPLLQKLKLENVVFRSPTWETVEGQFPSLMSLELKWCFLKEWTVSDSFPLLRDLSLLMVRELEEIPLKIGERGTLRSISLYDCLESVVKSATKILEEEEELNGKQSNLHVRVDCRNKSDAEALQGLSASPNFHVLVDKFFSEPPKLLRTLSWNL